MFILRTTQPPSLQKLLELERIVIVDNAGVNVPAGTSAVRACLVGEFLQGPFGPTIVRSSGDVQNLYVGPDATKFVRISQGSYNPAGSGVDTDGSGVTFDGNGWAELKGKTFSGLVIQRVDCDMVTGNLTAAKAYVSFTVTVDSTDITSGKTNKDLVIPSGARFSSADGTSNIVALSQQITIPAGTTTAGTITCAINFTQDASTGFLTYVATGGKIGATAFFVTGLVAGPWAATAGTAPITKPLDSAIPNVKSTIAASASTVDITNTAADAYPPAGGGAAPSPDTLSNRILCNYNAAIDKTLPGQPATSDIAAIWSARNYHCTASTGVTMSSIRQKLWTANAVAASTTGRGRVACVTAAPCTDLSYTDAITTTLALYTGQKATDSVVGPDADRYWLSGPYVQVFSQELNADITISSCGFRAAEKVNLYNDGRSEYLTSVGTPFNSTIDNIDAQEPGFAANPLPNDTYYRDLKAAGVAWLVQDRTAGWWFYSGVTAADPIQYANRVDDNRRSFADEVEDQILALATRYSKLPGTTEREDAFASDMKAYLDGLVNPPPGVDARAKQYQVLDGAKAGNTDTLNGQGVYLFSASVVMFGSMKTIMITAAIGTTVVITQVS